MLEKKSGVKPITSPQEGNDLIERAVKRFAKLSVKNLM